MILGISASGRANGETAKMVKGILEASGPVRCIGCCALAPAMRIDGITFGHMRLNQVQKVLERFE